MEFERLLISQCSESKVEHSIGAPDQFVDPFKVALGPLWQSLDERVNSCGIQVGVSVNIKDILTLAITPVIGLGDCS